MNDFKKHLRKYINLWRPDSPFEVTTTNRYTITTHEAAVVARRNIKKGETIKYLCGTLVEMTPEEEKNLDLTRRDFSIVTSSRKKKSLLFLGPARFANHDCNANARLTTTGSDGMSIVAVRPIAQNEEITVIYGEDYFGSDNCECLCGTCESNSRGGWTPLPGTLAKEQTPGTPAEEGNGPYSFRQKRRYERMSSSPATSDLEEFVPTKRRRSSGSERSRPTSLTPPRGRGRKTKPRVPSALSRFPPETNEENVMVDIDNTVPSTVEATPSTEHPLLVPSESDLKDDIGVSKSDEVDFWKPSEDRQSPLVSNPNINPRAEFNVTGLCNTAIKREMSLPTLGYEETPDQVTLEKSVPQLDPIMSTSAVDSGTQDQVRKGHELEDLKNYAAGIEKRKFDGLSEPEPDFSPTAKACTEETVRRVSAAFECKERLMLVKTANTSPEASENSELNNSQSKKRKVENLEDNASNLASLMSSAKKARIDAGDMASDRALTLDTSLEDSTGKQVHSSDPSAGDSSDMDSVFEKEEVNLIPTGTPESSQLELPPDIKIEEADESFPLTPTLVQAEDFLTDVNQNTVNSEIEENPFLAYESELSDLPSEEEVDDIHHTVVRRKKKSKSRIKKLAPPNPIIPEPEIKLVRYPYDYVNTPILLAEPCSSWAQCKTCANLFVQPNAYFHRRECPRCERHSIIYGYQWPKSEQFEDDEDRVMDHRTVHRFLSNGEEVFLKKKTKLAEQASLTR